MYGEHDRHDAGWGLRPGLIGGYRCDCPGDCAEKFARMAEELHRTIFAPPARGGDQDG